VHAGAAIATAPTQTPGGTALVPARLVNRHLEPPPGHRAAQTL